MRLHAAVAGREVGERDVEAVRAVVVVLRVRVELRHRVGHVVADRRPLRLVAERLRGLDRRGTGERLRDEEHEVDAGILHALDRHLLLVTRLRTFRAGSTASAATLYPSAAMPGLQRLVGLLLLIGDVLPDDPDLLALQQRGIVEDPAARRDRAACSRSRCATRARRADPWRSCRGSPASCPS